MHGTSNSQSYQDAGLPAHLPKTGKLSHLPRVQFTQHVYSDVHACCLGVRLTRPFHKEPKRSYANGQPPTSLQSQSVLTPNPAAILLIAAGGGHPFLLSPDPLG